MRNYVANSGKRAGPVRGQTNAAAKSLLKAWRKNKVVLEDKYYSKATHHDVAGLTLNEVMAAEILRARY